MIKLRMHADPNPDLDTNAFEKSDIWIRIIFN